MARRILVFLFLGATLSTIAHAQSWRYIDHGPDPMTDEKVAYFQIESTGTILSHDGKPVTGQLRVSCVPGQNPFASFSSPARLSMNPMLQTNYGVRVDKNRAKFLSNQPVERDYRTLSLGLIDGFTVNSNGASPSHLLLQIEVDGQRDQVLDFPIYGLRELAAQRGCPIS